MSNRCSICDEPRKYVPERVTRRMFLKSGAAAYGALTTLEHAFSVSQYPSEAWPNVVMIISDDQGWADYGFMSHSAIRTPRLDRLANESVIFTRGYVAAPLCCPSLGAIVTGLHPHQNRITSNDPPFIGEKRGWPPERLAMREQMIANVERVPTLPRMLAEMGYMSFQTGKWWQGNYSRGGFTQGMTHGDPARGGRHGDAGLEIGRTTMQPIYDFIDSAGDKPFFLWYAPIMPHLPHNPPDRLLDYYKGKTDSLHVAGYWAMCEWFDETCGQLLDYLEQKGLAENTLVLYVCDNGWIQKPNARGVAPRSKLTPYEGGVRTPIMVRWPGHVKPGRDEETLVSSIDLAPTVLAACGLQPTGEMQGINLLDEGALAGRETIFGAAYTHNAVDINDPAENLQHRWCVHGRWKLIVPQETAKGDAPVELYDVKADPHETRNVASQNAVVVERLLTLIDRWYRPQSSTLLK